MVLKDLPLTFFGNLEKDFRAEVTAAEWVEGGMPEDRVLILLLGALKRSFRKDVDAIEETVSAYDHKEYLLIKTHREGLYDMLPEGLFHHPSAHRTALSEKEIILVMKQRQAEEQAARRFFLPFEAATNHQRMQMALYENRLDKHTHYDDKVRLFADHWDIFQYLDVRQSNLFLHLIPIMHDLRDNHPVIEAIMEMMFELPVQISLREQQPLDPGEPVLSKLGDSSLGVDFTTGNMRHDEGEAEILIRIGPLSNELFQQFLPGARNGKILQLLCDYLLPVHLDVVTDYLLPEEERETRLSDSANPYHSALGTDTYL